MQPGRIQQRLFQFTPLREGRHARTEGVENGGYFNSRPSARGDRKTSVHLFRWFYFNSRPSARGDAMLNMSITGRLYFNSRPSARGDLYRGQNSFQHEFQFTPLREGRRGSRSVSWYDANYFNSRPSARGDTYIIHRLV